MISNCGHDEKGQYRGGKAGDQTGTEWQLKNWYNRPWKCVLRHPDARVRAELAKLAMAAANNNLVGYDQDQRNTYYVHLKASNWDPAQITIACEADCSSGVSANVVAAGHRLGIPALQKVSPTLSTYGMRAALKAAGFTVLTDSKYLTSDAYLLPGDIILNDSEHVATNLTAGSKSGGTSPAPSPTPSKVSKTEVATGFSRSLAGTYKVNTNSDPLMLRSGAGTNKTVLASMPKGSKVQNYGYYSTSNGTKWLYVVYNGIVGFCSSIYLKKV